MLNNFKFEGTKMLSSKHTLKRAIRASWTALAILSLSIAGAQFVAHSRTMDAKRALTISHR
ncbi:MAG: hypothetical protein EOP84_29255 [Verrucomicrobiaceae bacterium]|nr:MAG: hypothetical protein EOP84_29255 [Verrucomicrobiaceae bacterium]